MKTNAKKLLLTTAITVGLIGGAFMNKAFAASDTMDAQVQTRPAIAITAGTDINFGRLDVVVATQDRTITLAPTGNTVTASGGTVGTVVVGGGTPASGQVTITTDATSTFDVTCNTTAAMDNGAGDELALSAITLAGVSGSAFTTGTCNATVTSITPTAASVVLGVGAAIAFDTTTNNAATGVNTYNTTTGGTPITITAVYQ